MDKRRRERQAPFSRSDERHRSTLNVFRLCSLRSSRKGKEKGWGGRGAGGEGLDDVRAQGPPLAIKSRGSSTRFHTKIIFIALPTCVPPLCATWRSDREREKQPLLLILEPAAVTLDRIIASQRGIYCNGWRERERGFQPVGFSTYFFFCKFWNLILRVSHVTNFSTFLPFIYPSI